MVEMVFPYSCRFICHVLYRYIDTFSHVHPHELRPAGVCPTPGPLAWTSNSQMYSVCGIIQTGETARDLLPFGMYSAYISSSSRVVPLRLSCDGHPRSTVALGPGLLSFACSFGYTFMSKGT